MKKAEILMKILMVLSLTALIVGLIPGHISFLDGRPSGFIGFSPQIKNKPPLSPHQNKMLIFIIDFRSFMCPACLDSFLEFHQLISPWQMTMTVWGVLVVDPPSNAEDEEITIGIAAKKAQGFLTANALQFPLIVDRFHVFSPLAGKGTSVIFCDDENKIIKKYSFPLAPSQLKEIINYIQDEK